MGTLGRDMEANRKKIEACLRHRKYLLRDMFENTPGNVEGLRRVAIMIRDKAAMLHEKGNQLCQQMHDIWQRGENAPFTDFVVELSLVVCFNDETSVLHLADDGTGSDYVKMAEFIDTFEDKDGFPGNLMPDEHHHSQELKPFTFLDCDGKVDDWGEQCFFGNVPESEWRKIPIVHEFHSLLESSHYALQDIIRINDIWSEAKVTWQHIDR